MGQGIRVHYVLPSVHLRPVVNVEDQNLSVIRARDIFTLFLISPHDKHNLAPVFHLLLSLFKEAA